MALTRQPRPTRISMNGPKSCCGSTWSATPRTAFVPARVGDRAPRRGIARDRVALQCVLFEQRARPFHAAPSWPS